MHTTKKAVPQGSGTRAGCVTCTAMHEKTQGGSVATEEIRSTTHTRTTGPVAPGATSARTTACLAPDVGHAH
eukprot:7620167-Pyramimonas_sp.AAC.1